MPTEPAGLDVAREIRRLIQEQAPAWQSRELADGLALGSEGIGLDSVGIVELLLACEKRFGVKFPLELLEQAPLTVGRLVEYVRNARN